MDASSLSRRDVLVLEKIKDPEANLVASILVDASLPKDPHLVDPALYERVSQREREIVLSMQQLETQLADAESVTSDPAEKYRKCVERLGELITEYPTYASIRNNRAQALRRMYGNVMLLGIPDSQALVQHASPEDRTQAVATTLSDLDEVVNLLAPKTLFGSISPQAAKTLALAHTQRAAIYHMTAKAMSNDSVELSSTRREAAWGKLDFEEAASRDFAHGGRYGNEVAKGLAVSTNPTAKLCGQIVREALRKEYGPAYRG